MNARRLSPGNEAGKAPLPTMTFPERSRTHPMGPVPWGPEYVLPPPTSACPHKQPLALPEHPIGTRIYCICRTIRRRTGIAFRADLSAPRGRIASVRDTARRIASRAKRAHLFADTRYGIPFRG